MEHFKVDDSTLSAHEFYEKFKDKEKSLNIFEQADEESNINQAKKKDAPRPVIPIDLAIKKPPESHAELTKCFRERLRLHDDLKCVSAENQMELADVLTVAIVSVWPEHRKQAPDPFLSEIGNRELQRRVAVFVIKTSEQLFYTYIQRAEELNLKGIFSSDANISRLKTQLLHEAYSSLNILNIRRKLAEEMRHIHNERWFTALAPNDRISFMSSANQPSLDWEANIFHDKSHEQYVNRQLSEMQQQMPTLEFNHVIKMNSIKPIVIDASKVATSDPLNVVVSEKNCIQLVSQSPSQVDTEISKERSCLSPMHEETKPVLKRSDSMPDISDQSELGEELRNIKEGSIQRKYSVSQMLLNGCSNDGFDLKSQAIQSNIIEETSHDANETASERERLKEDDFSPLLQYHGKQISPKKTITTKPIVNKNNDEDDDFESFDIENGLTNDELSEQPKVLNVKVPGKGIVRISDVKISNEIEETKLTLHMHPTIYNEFLDEIDDETVKSLDKHLFAGEEITDVYDEITKTLSKDHLCFDKDDFVEACPSKSMDASSLFMSAMLTKNTNQNVSNSALKREWIPPWNEYTSANEWRNEPKFAGIGREDILKFDMKRTSISHVRLSTFMKGIDMASINKLMKSYNSWLSWYKTNLTTDDYRKFISTKENDFLSQIYHLYDSDNDDNDLEEERARTSADLKKLNERTKRKQELRVEKRKYEKGYWNSQSVLLGGLGNDPSVTDFLNDDIENEKGDNEGKVSSVMLQDRFDQIWNSLKMSDQERLSMAIKYSSLETIDILDEVVGHWENVSDFIIQREGYMKKLEHFERSASDPNRFFVKGPTGSSVARINEAKTREKLNKKIKALDGEIKPMLELIQNRYNDQVTYQGRSYLQKMQSDRIEMLYWLQQERRKQALEIQPNITRSNTPVKRIELNPLS